MQQSGESNKNEKLHAYMIPANTNPNSKRNSNYKNHHNRLSNQSYDKKNQSLPSITLHKDEKVNVIRNQIEEKKHQIQMMKARLNSLKYQKQKNEKKKQKTHKQIQFIQTVRERVFQNQKYKQTMNQQRARELELMKNQANQLRQQLIKNRELSKSIVKEKKSDEAQQQRQRRQDQEQYIKRVRSIQIDQNRFKAKKIKQEQHEIEEKMNQFNESRIMFAKKNHTSRVEKSLSEKNKAEKILHKLKRQQSRLIEDFKKSEADMLNSIYELESINPEKKRKFTTNSTKTSQKNFRNI